jgi:hypothetical protein
MPPKRKKNSSQKQKHISNEEQMRDLFDEMAINNKKGENKNKKKEKKKKIETRNCTNINAISKFTFFRKTENKIRHIKIEL